VINERKAMKKILLVNPRYEMEILRVVDEEHMDVKTDSMPLGLATVAALTPDEFQVDIWDESMRGPVEKSGMDCSEYDLVGVTGTRVMLLRTREVAAFFRNKGIPVAVGGTGVSATPDRFRGHFDILFIGEAELTWRQFLKDWQAGSYKPEYRQIEKPDIALSPMPRWDSIVPDIKKYAMGGVQTTRGCPYDCEFCDVVYLHGRNQRHKPVQRVIDEVKVLEKLGVQTIFFTDDNFVGNHRYAKEVLRALIPVNNSFARPLKYTTQASMDTSNDEELMELLADANFYEMFIGIESPNKESLKEISKNQNLQGDLVENIHKILSYGLSVRGAFIGGFDHDDADIFDKQYEFIQKAYIPSVSPHILNAPIGTRLWRRLRKEGRVLDIIKMTNKATQRIICNTIPKRMSRVELMKGYRELHVKLYNWNSFRERVIGYISLVKRSPAVRQAPVSLEELMKLGQSLHLDEDACRAIEEIVTYTNQKAPFLLGRVKELIVQFAAHAKSAHNLIPKMDKNIELEKSGELTFELDNRPITVPQGFRDSYRSIFPDVYRRVYQNLRDKDKVSQAVVEIFVEFLVKEEGFTQMEEHHRILLGEIIYRTCARMNGQNIEEFTPAEPSDVPVPDVKRLRLGDDIINSVEQELLKLVQV
jgi:radical SAM superfamily enzyme YgiQ (UPF0313 family)